MPSNTRSTATDASEVEKLTDGICRVSAYGRASSPARSGMTFVTITPMAVDDQSGPNGSFGATGSRIVRHRRARSGNMHVATAALRISSQ